MVDAKTLLEEVLEKIAKEQKYDGYKTEVKPVNSGGANYTAELFEVLLSAPGKDNVKLFAKVANIGEDFRAFISLQIFVTETLFYTKAIPRYKEFEEAYKFPEEDRLIVAKYYGGNTEYMKESLVMEDLTAEGYEQFDRFKCVDWEYASTCVNALAQIHALSIRYERDHPEEYADLVQKLKISMPMDTMRGFFEKAIAPALNVTDEENKERLTNFFEDQMKDEVFITYYNTPHQITMNHGDFRPSNILHKKDKNGKLKVALLDYQICQKGNPIMDLLFFLVCGTDEAFREKHLNQYFDHYYEEFSKTLQRLEINPDEIYTKEDYEVDLKKLLPFGIMFGALSLPVITVDTEDAPKPEDRIDLDDFLVKTSDLFQERFNGLVRDYIKLGIV